MNDFRLPLFPADSVAASVTVSVWIGVWIVVFFNLRFGWTLSGLVVPGYLVPLLLVKPSAAVIICIESVITYLIVRLLSEGWGPRGWGWLPCWCSLFGRDRFFAIVLVSVLVRAVIDGWLVPELGEWINTTFRISLDYRNDLHSYGLIVVALLANYLWKPGLVRGASTSAVTVGLTYVVLRYGMLNYTNFGLGALHYLYEDVATSLLSSPKSYVLIFATSYLASRMNLRYSWDFNGILIPALLGLLWHEPQKILVTLVETGWILFLATWVLRWPIWQKTTVEGGRKLLLFFSLAAFHRLALAHQAPILNWPHVTDYYGFGYLLTSLMAIKIYDKGLPLRVLRATVQTSLVGAVAGTFIGFSLTMLPSERSVARPITAETSPSSWRQDDRDLWPFLNESRVRLYSNRLPSSYIPATPSDLYRFRSAITECLRYVEDGNAKHLENAAVALRPIRYDLVLVKGRYLCFEEQAPVRGWGTFVIDTRHASQLLVEVPAPLDEWSTLEAGLVIFQEMEGRAFALGGTGRETNNDRNSDMLLQPQTLLSTFHRLLDEEDVVQIRGYTEWMIQATQRLKKLELQEAARILPTRMWVRKAIPPSLKFSRLQRLLDQVDVQWQDAPGANVLRDMTPRGYAELILSRPDRQRLRNRLITAADRESDTLSNASQPLREWLLQDANHMARQGSDLYRPALVEEMLFLDEEVVRPLLRICRQPDAADAESQQERQEELASLSDAASAVGYQLTQLDDPSTKERFVVLAERLPKQRHWGTFVFRYGLASPYLLEVPRPLYEQNAYPFAITMFERLRASVFLVAGAHPLANTDGSADVTRIANKVNAFQLVRQVLLRELADRPTMIVQTRAIQSPVGADIVLATDDGSFQREQLSELAEQVANQLDQDGWTLQLADGSEALAGYELSLMMQVNSIQTSPQAQMLGLWLSPSVRRQFRDVSTMTAEEARFSAVGIRTETGDLWEYVSNRLVGTKVTPRDETIVDRVSRHIHNSDILPLFELTRRFSSFEFLRFLDEPTGRAFLLVYAAPDARPLVVRLEASSPEAKETRMKTSEWTREKISEFTRSHLFTLEWEATP